MSLVREEYDRHWQRHPHSSRGPVNWRAGHHREPDREFVSLCQAADRQGLRVELSVKDGEPLETERGDKYRLLDRLIVAKDNEPLVIVDVTAARGVSAAAATATSQLRRLEAA